MTTNGRAFGHAVIIGGSVAGLLAARVLSDHFKHVTILERGPRPDGSEPRKQTPQAQHAHLLLEAAVKGFEQLFPGIIRELQDAGAVSFDPGQSAVLYHYGAWKPRFATGMETVGCTRPLIEYHVRRRTEALPNVEIRYEHTAERLVCSAGRITGVCIRREAGEDTLQADLVVDAAGRGTRAPRWLEDLGYGRPEEDQVGLDLAYVSRLYERPADCAVDWKGLAIYSPLPGKRGAFVFEIEKNRWIVSLTGYFGDHAPMDDAGFLEFLRSLPVPEPYEAVVSGKPLTAPVKHKIPTSRWFRYDKMGRFPDGLLIVGDSVLALNPLYGQGITVTVQTMRALRQALQDLAHSGGDLAGLLRAFPKQHTRFAAQAWMLSTLMDLRHPEAEGKRPPGLAALQWTFANLIDLTSLDKRACGIFYDMVHMRRGPEALVHPHLLPSLLAYSAKSLFVPRDERIYRGTLPRAS